MAEPESSSPSSSEIQRELGISDARINSGIIQLGELDELWHGFKNSDDRCTEHVRWRKFVAFFDTHRSLDAKLAEEIYALGSTDLDLSMGESIMIRVLKHHDCPIDLVMQASRSDRKSVHKVAEAVKAKREV